MVIWASATGCPLVTSVTRPVSELCCASADFAVKVVKPNSAAIASERRTQCRVIGASMTGVGTCRIHGGTTEVEPGQRRFEVAPTYFALQWQQENNRRQFPMHSAIYRGPSARITEARSSLSTARPAEFPSFP